MQALFQAASSEFQLAAACCGWPPRPARAERIAQLSQGTAGALDWSSFVRLVQRHRIAGFAHQALSGNEAVPAEVQKCLSKFAIAIAQKNLLSIAVTSRLARQFEQEAVPFVVLKGAPLAQLAYGDVTLRHSKDIDVLVQPQDVRRAGALLEDLGFARTALASSLADHQQALWLRSRKHFEYMHRPTGVHLELHWRTLDNRNVPAVDLFAKRQWVSVTPGVELPTLPRKDLLLQLCAHGASHAWFRLKWIADIAALVAQENSGDLASLLQQARHGDIDRPLQQALLLSESLFGIPDGRSFTPPSRTVRWMSTVARNALLAEDHDNISSSQAEFVPRGQKTLRFFLRRSWRYRVEELRVHAASPIDWQTLRLPPRLQFVYPGLRLPLWIKRRLSSRSRS